MRQCGNKICTTTSIIIVLNAQASVVSTASLNTTSRSTQQATKSEVSTLKSHTLQLLIGSIGQGCADHCHRLVKVYSISKLDGLRTASSGPGKCASLVGAGG